MSEPDGWQLRSLASLGTYENGFAFNERHWADHGLPIVRIAQITGSQEVVDWYEGNLPEAFRIESGDIIFSWSGTLAVVRWKGGPAWLNQHLFKVSPFRDISAGFLFHALQFSVAEMGRRAHGSTMKHIKRGELEEFVVSVPTVIAEQAKVARILDALDAAIAQTEAIVAKLKAVKQGLLHDLLTRGIDANGELRPPQSEAPQLYKQSALGWIPNEWGVQRLGDIGEFTNGLNKPKHAFGYGTKFVNISDVYADYMDTSSLGRVHTTHDDLTRYQLLPGDIVLDRSSVKLEGVGYPSVFSDDTEPVVFCGFIIRFRMHDHDAVVPRYVCLQMRDARFRNDVFKVATGGANINVNQASLRDLLVKVPGGREQEAIIVRERALDDRLELEIQLRDKLSSQKSGLMDDLLTGRVRVTPLLDATTA
jgi:type I restriction enzyme S subunit